MISNGSGLGPAERAPSSTKALKLRSKASQSAGTFCPDGGGLATHFSNGKQVVSRSTTSFTAANGPCFQSTSPCTLPTLGQPVLFSLPMRALVNTSTVNVRGIADSSAASAVGVSTLTAASGIVPASPDGAWLEPPHAPPPDNAALASSSAVISKRRRKGIEPRQAIAGARAHCRYRGNGFVRPIRIIARRPEAIVRTWIEPR